MSNPERLNPKRQISEINLAMIEKFNGLYSERMLAGGLSRQEQEKMEQYVGEMLSISASIYQQFMRQGGLGEPQLEIGSCRKRFDQGRYLKESPVGALRLESIEPLTIPDVPWALWQTKIDGLSLVRQLHDDEGSYKYYLIRRPKAIIVRS